MKLILFCILEIQNFSLVRLIFNIRIRSDIYKNRRVVGAVVTGQKKDISVIICDDVSVNI